MPNATVRANAQAMPIDRRTMFGSLAAGALLAVPKFAKAAAGGDATLLALGREFEAAWKREIALSKTCSDAEFEDDASDVSRAAAFTKSLVLRIYRADAKTMDGIQVKARAFLWCYADDAEEALACLEQQAKTTDYKMLHSIMRDLLASAEA